MKALYLSAIVVLLFVINGYCFLSVSPSVTEKTAKPGKTLTVEFAVANQEEATMLVETLVDLSWWKQTTGSNELSEKAVKVYPQKPFLLKNGESKKVIVDIKIPINATGELATMLYFVASPQGQSGKMLNIKTRNGVPIYIFTGTSSKTNFELSSFYVNVSSVNGVRALNCVLSIKNNGPSHFRPKGEVKISCPSGEFVGKMDYGFPVFPNRSEKFRVSFENKDWPAGTYKCTANINVNSPFLDNLDNEVIVGVNKEIEVK